MLNVNKVFIKAIIFDCDGTLVDSEHAHLSSWQYAIRKQGGDLQPDEYPTYVGKSTGTVAKILAEKLGRDCAEQLVKDKREYYNILQNAGHLPIQPTIDFLRRLASEKEHLNLKLGLASAARKEGILMNLRHHRIEHLFDVILSGQDDLADYIDSEGVNKPKPYIYLQTAKMLNVKPSECVVVEDSRAGVTAGVDAGCLTIAVPNHYSQHQDLSHAHLIIESFSKMGVDEFLELLKKCNRITKEEFL